MSDAADCDTIAWLDTLFREERIDLRRGALFGSTPKCFVPRRDRVEGMLLGLAIGDALGNTSEGMTPAHRAKRYGEIRDYLPNEYADGRRVGLPSDDSQMALWTLEQLIDDGGYFPEHVARAFTTRQIFGMGSSVGQSLMRFTRDGLPWHRAGVPSAGNGALMRIAPMLLPHLREPSPALWADTALCAMTTHNDSAAIASALAFIGMLWDLLAMDAPPEPSWWWEHYVELSTDLESDTRYTPRDGKFVGWEGTLSQFVREHVPEAAGRRLTTLEACEEWYSGAFLLETVPSLLYILSRHGADPEQAIVRAVNDTRDNDTIAAIVGASIGALHGTSALPARWRTALLGRTGRDDDGRVGELVNSAWAAFGDAESIV